MSLMLSIIAYSLLPPHSDIFPCYWEFYRLNHRRIQLLCSISDTSRLMFTGGIDGGDPRMVTHNVGAR
jgi:hypothetical protein